MKLDRPSLVLPKTSNTIELTLSFTLSAHETQKIGWFGKGRIEITRDALKDLAYGRDTTLGILSAQRDIVGAHAYAHQFTPPSTVQQSFSVTFAHLDPISIGPRLNRLLESTVAPTMIQRARRGTAPGGF